MPPRRDAAPHAEAGTAGRGGTDGSDAATSGMDAGGVRIELGRSRICRGECTTVRVVEASEDYGTYVWEPPLADGPGPHRVCPETTTTVRVRATRDLGELGAIEHAGRARLAVVDRCADASMHADAGMRDAGAGNVDPPAWTQPEPPTCSATFEASDLVQARAMGGDEGAVVVGSFRGTLTLGDHVLRSPDVKNGFVARFDASCRPVWARRVAATGKSYAHAVVREPGGDYYVAGAFTGIAQLGGAPLIAGGELHFLLLRLDPAGELVSQQQFPTGGSPEQGTQTIEALTTDDAGRLQFSGYGLGSAQLLNGPLAAMQPDTTFQFVDAAADGYPWLSPFDRTFAVASPEGGTVLSGKIRGTYSWAGGTRGRADTPYEVVARLDANGAEAWALLLPDESNDGRGLFLGRPPLALGHDGTVYHTHVVQVDENLYGYAIAAVTSDGTLKRQGPPLIHKEVGQPLYFPMEHALDVDGTGALWEAAIYDEHHPVAGRMLSTTGGRDFIVLQLDARGQARWAGAVGTPANDVYLRLHATPNGAAFVAGVGRYGEPEDSPVLLLARFDPR